MGTDADLECVPAGPCMIHCVVSTGIRNQRRNESVHRHARVAIAVACVALLITTAATGGAAVPLASFAAADAAMRARVHDDRLDGGVLLAVRGSIVLHERSFGKMTPRTVIPIASASKWLTSA